MESQPEDPPKFDVVPEVDYLGQLPPALVRQLVDVVRRELHKDGVQTLVITNSVVNITVNTGDDKSINGKRSINSGLASLGLVCQRASDAAEVDVPGQ